LPYCCSHHPSRAGFSLTSLPAGPINPGDSSSFTVTYDPTAAGRHNATVTTGSDATNAASFSFNIRCTGKNTAPPEPEIALRGGDTFDSVIQSGDVTPRVADGTDYGQIEIGSSVVHAFQLLILLC
jgi:hypothetical protein